MPIVKMLCTNNVRVCVLLSVTVSGSNNAENTCTCVRFLTFCDTCGPLSWKFMMAPEILMLIGSTTTSMLNGPFNLSPSFCKESAMYKRTESH